MKDIHTSTRESHQCSLTQQPHPHPIVLVWAASVGKLGQFQSGDRRGR